MATEQQIAAAEAALREFDDDEANWPTGEQVAAIIDAAATVSPAVDDESDAEVADPDERPRTGCGCGFDIVYTGDGWQHDAAPWFWGNDHDPDPDPHAEAEAEVWDAAHPDEN